MNENYKLMAYSYEKDITLFSNLKLDVIDQITSRYQNSPDMAKFYGLEEKTYFYIVDQNCNKVLNVYFAGDREKCIDKLMAYYGNEKLQQQYNLDNTYLAYYFANQSNFIIRKMISILEKTDNGLKKLIRSK